MVNSRRAIASLSLLAMASFSLNACAKGDDGHASAVAVADELAHGLSVFDTSGLRFAQVDTETVSAELKELTDGLDGMYPSVTASDVNVDGDQGKATLSVSWPVRGKPWEYQVPLELVRDGKEFLPVWNPKLLEPSLGQGEMLVLKTQQAQRGEILGQGGEKIVTSRPVFRVGIDKSHLNGADPKAAAKKLAALVGVAPDPFAEQVGSASPKAFVQALTLRAQSELAVKLDRQVLSTIPGAAALPDYRPLAPSRDFARPVLGTVAEATREQIEKSAGALQVGDLTGTGGLQERYDEFLRGHDGFEIVARTPSDPKAPPALPTDRKLYVSASTPGPVLKTTLDVRLQNAAELVLAEVKGPSALVALRPSDGSVLAAASGPGSDGYDTALQGQYAPGSTFKIVDSLALMRNGISPATKVLCSAKAEVNGREFLNSPGYPKKSVGEVPLSEAFAHSCNTAFINQRDTVSQEQIESAARSLGVGIPGQKLDFAAFMGSVPDTAEGTEHAANMIGQGQVTFSPLAAAVMAASTTGKTVTPHLLMPGAVPPGKGPGAVSSGTNSLEPATTESKAPAPSAAEAKGLAALMRGVVSSGHAGYLNDVPGSAVGAKTGTAEYGDAKPPKTHSWIVAVQGDLAVAVLVEDGGVGDPVSGPLLKDFLTRING